jgi:hypothetical protein
MCNVEIVRDKMVTLAKHSLKLRYEGRSADSNQLEFYDGATSIYGFAQSLQIVTHAYLNNEIVTRATAMRGAEMFMRPAGKGSYLVEIVTMIEQYPAVSSMATAIAAPVFYDFLKVVFKKATGVSVGQPETKLHAKRIGERRTVF